MHVTMDARSHHSLGRGEQIPEIHISERTSIIAEEGRLTTAFGCFFLYFATKSRGNPLALKVKEDRSTISITYGIRSDTPQEVVAKRMPFENYLRRAHQLFVGAGATMQEKVVPDALEYTISLPKAH